MKKLIIILVLALGVIACDKDDNEDYYSQLDQFEEFRIGPSGNFITINDLLESGNASGHYQDSVFVVVYNSLGIKYTISLDEDYGCVVILNCSINNMSVDYEIFKIKLLNSYNNL